MTQIKRLSKSGRHNSPKTHSKVGRGDLRIIGGQWKRTKIEFPLLPGLRPTPSRVRETLFNWLAQDVNASHCLDLFAGSGALGFEALSRHAASVCFVDQSQAVITSLKSQVEKIQAEGAQLICADALALADLTQKLNRSFDIIFCDPPFHQGLIEPLLQSLNASDLIAKGGKVYVETEKSLKHLNVPNDWELLREKTAGDVLYRLYQT